MPRLVLVGNEPARRRGRPALRLAVAALSVITTVMVIAVLASPPSGPDARARSAAALAAERRRSVTIQWVGDIALSTERGLPAGGLTGALAPVSGLLHWAQVTTGNLEGTLSVGGTPTCGAPVSSGGCLALQAPPGYAAQLRTLGFAVMNQANDHSMDFGASGRAQTVAALHAAGLLETGYPGQITYLGVHGVRIAFLGFAPWPYDASLLDLPAAQALVRTARRHAGIVVVFVHDGAEGANETHTPAGDEYVQGQDRGDVRAFAHAVIDAGATVVLGSGPQVIRGVEDYRGHLIAYSAGNFAGAHTLETGGVLDDSAIVRVRLSASGALLAADWVPITLVGGLPRPDPTGASIRLMQMLSVEDFPGDHFDVTASGAFDLGGS